MNSYTHSKGRLAGIQGRTETAPPAGGWGSLIAIIALCGLAAAAGWYYLRQTPSQPLTLLSAQDVSGSMDKEKKQQCARTLSAVIDDVLPPGSLVAFWLYDRYAHKVYHSRPTGSDDVLGAAKYSVDYRSKTWGTYISAALEPMVDIAEKEARQSRPVALLFLTDGEDTDPAATAKLVRRLAALHNVKAVWILPVDPADPVDPKTNFRAELGRTFGSIGDRAIISTAFDAPDDLNHFRQLLRR